VQLLFGESAQNMVVDFIGVLFTKKLFLSTQKSHNFGKPRSENPNQSSAHTHPIKKWEKLQIPWRTRMQMEVEKSNKKRETIFHIILKL
jgi:hypothetical protein